MITVIGTSTTLVVNATLVDAGQPEIRLLEIGRIGVLVAAVGVVYMLLVAPTVAAQPYRHGQRL